MYEPERYDDPVAIGDVDAGQFIEVNAPLDDNWKLLHTDLETLVETSEPAREAWLTDQLMSDTLKDRKGRYRIITGAFEAAGTCASGHQYSKFDEDFRHESHERIIRYHPPDMGPELAAYKTMHAENAVDSITEYVVPKWKIVRPSRRDKLGRLASTAAAEMAVFNDSKVTRHVNYDKFRFAMQAQRELQRQAEEKGSVDRAVNPFYEHDGITPGPGDKLTQMKCRLEHPDVMPYPELAASLLSRPSDTLRSFYRRDPKAGAKLRRTLEEIANATNEEGMLEDEFRTMNRLIRHHLTEADVNRILDPRMIQYVKQSDPRHVEANALRQSYEIVHRAVCGTSSEIQEAFHPIIFPLAVHMRDRNIPITVENVIAEGDALLQTREVLEHLATTPSAQMFNGGIQTFLDHANDEEIEILNNNSRKVVAMLMPGRSAVSTNLPIYGEEDIDRIAKTMFGPRQTGGTSMRSGFSSGGYHQPGSRAINPIEQRQSPQGGERGQHLSYSPFTEGHDLLRRTKIRKFRPPVW